MDDPNITMEEYIRLEEERARRNGKVYNWETATYGKIWDDKDIHDLRFIETEFSAIVFDDMFTSELTLSCEPTVSPLNDNKIYFRISFDESDDEDYTKNMLYLKTLKNSRPLPNFEEYAVSTSTDTPHDTLVNYQEKHVFSQYSVSETPILRIGQYSISEDPILRIGQYAISNNRIWCLAVPVFSPRDDTTSYLNKAMAFLTAATIQDGRVTMQQVQGRQGQSYVGNGNKGNANRSGGTNAGWQARVVKCYNCQGEGHMARQCTHPKRPRNTAWFKEKAMILN
ncbi:hypothetical protein Tco_0324452 [Tanacetum coccineum]